MGAVNIDKKSLASSPTDTWVNQPGDSDNVSEGAAEIRDAKATLRGIISQEHYIDDESVGEGIHVEGSARVFVEDDNTVSPTHNEKGRVVFYPSDRKMFVSDGDDWLGVGAVYPGLISMSAVAPTPSTDFWAVCDGRTVDTDMDGGIYEPLIHRLAGSGATQAYLPDLRDRFVRGADTAGGGSTALAAGARTVNAQSEAESADEAFDFQGHAFQDHSHQMDHTHGADIADGYDEGNGSTGKLDSWNAGSVTLEKDILGAAASDDEETFDGTTLKVIPVGDKVDKANGEGHAADNAWTAEVNLEHRHAIVRYWGLTRLASARDEDAPHGVPDRTDSWETADETRPDNVVLYFVIKL